MIFFGSVLRSYRFFGAVFPYLAIVLKDGMLSVSLVDFCCFWCPGLLSDRFYKSAPFSSFATLGFLVCVFFVTVAAMVSHRV